MTSQPGPLSPLLAAAPIPGAVFFAKLLGIALVLAAVLNGASFYLKRTGLIEAQAYQAYWGLHCGPGRHSGGAAPAPGPPCHVGAPETIQSLQSSAEREQTRYLYSGARAELALKLVKDALFIFTILLSLYWMMRGGSQLPGGAPGWPLYLLAAYVLVACVFALAAGAWVGAAAGMRAFMFLGIALTGAWLAPSLATIAGGVGFLLVLEALLVPYELYSGVHVYGHFDTLPFAGRAAGTLVLPNSLSAFAAVALAFYHAFATAPRMRLIGAASLALALASGSGTGLACLLLFWFMLLLERAGPQRRVALAGLGLALAVALAAALPSLTGRPQLYDTLFASNGRIATLVNAAVGQPPQVNAFGRGLGANTNTAISLGHALDSSAVQPLPADSTVTSLFIQLGALGTLLFYLMLGWAAYRDAQARKFYAVLAAASLTINITELFPLNFLLGIALARSASNRRARA